MSDPWPICYEDEVLVGVGTYDGVGWWSAYVCGPARDDLPAYIGGPIDSGCDAAQVLVGTGTFANGHWDSYACGPTLPLPDTAMPQDGGLSALFCVIVWAMACIVARARYEHGRRVP